MISQRRFSDYHLFRRLKETPLATTYRAGRAQARAIDRVVLLHLFDRQPTTSGAFWERIHHRAPIQEVLQDPLFGRGVELGISAGIPFVAYDYQVGRPLDDIFNRARERRMPLSIDQALAIVDQVATALVEAQKLQFEGAPVLHGALTPELIHVSHRGKVKTYGFDTAPGLRTLDTDAKYRSPEIRGGAAAAADDVFSLAVILFESLTGLPPAKNIPFAAQVDQAVPFGEVSPLAPDLQDLLKHGLAARDMRTPDVVRWRQELRSVISGDAGSASAFQLSFFLHALFREELESESHEIQEEKASRWTVAAENTASEAAEAPESLTMPAELDGEERAPATEEDEETEIEEEAIAVDASPSGAAPPTDERQDRSPAYFLVGLAASLAVATIAATAFFWIDASATDDSAKAAPQSTLAGKADTQVARQVIASRAAMMEKDLKAEYEPRLADLREQLVTAHRRAANQSSAQLPQPVGDDAGLADDASPTEEAVQEPDTVDSAAEPAEPDASPSPVETATEPALDDMSDKIVLAALTERLGSDIESAPSSMLFLDTTTMEPSNVAPPPLSPSTSDARSEDIPVPIPATPPRLLQEPRPRYPRVAQRLGRSATVRLRVLVDETGKPVETELLSEPIGLGFEQEARRAVMASRWTAATLEGTGVSDWVVLKVEFKP